MQNVVRSTCTCINLHVAMGNPLLTFWYCGLGRVAVLGIKGGGVYRRWGINRVG